MRQILALPAAYKAFSSLVGAEHSRRVYVDQYVRPKPGDRVLDIGCGPGELLEFMPHVEYFGFDLSPAYIESARRRYGDRGRFYCQRVSEASAFVQNAGSYDVALASGVLHHLDDREALELFGIAHRALRPGGRLVTYDGAYVPGQSKMAAYLLSKDRGRHVRPAERYGELARSVFSEVRAAIRHDLLRIPYTHVILECTR